METRLIDCKLKKTPSEGLREEEKGEKEGKNTKLGPFLTGKIDFTYCVSRKNISMPGERPSRCRTFDQAVTNRLGGEGLAR